MTGKVPHRVARAHLPGARRALIAGFGFTMLLVPEVAVAGAATPWVQSQNAKTRLVVDRVDMKGQGKVLVAGVHVKLDEGWKTYWRNPGDAGLPPTFNWSGSRNLKSAKVLWPAPARFTDGAGTAYGYKKEVVFPVVIEPETGGQPVNLDLKLEYAVCADICIPAEAELRLETKGSGLFARSYAPLLKTYLNRIPSRIEPGPKKGLAISPAKAELTGSAPKLSIETHVPEGAKTADLFVEGPEGFYMAPAERAGESANGSVRFKVDLTKGDDPKQLKGKTVTLTLVSDSGQAETTWRIE